MPVSQKRTSQAETSNCKTPETMSSKSSNGLVEPEQNGQGELPILLGNGSQAGAWGNDGALGVMVEKGLQFYFLSKESHWLVLSREVIQTYFHFEWITLVTV